MLEALKQREVSHVIARDPLWVVVDPALLSCPPPLRWLSTGSSVESPARACREEKGAMATWWSSSTSSPPPRAREALLDPAPLHPWQEWGQRVRGGSEGKHLHCSPNVLHGGNPVARRRRWAVKYSGNGPQPLPPPQCGRLPHLSALDEDRQSGVMAALSPALFFSPTLPPNQKVSEGTPSSGTLDDMPLCTAQILNPNQ